MGSPRRIWLSMWILASAVLTASLMGSLHCVGMCGPLALWAAGADQQTSFGRMLVPTTLYHGGRLLTYMLVGFMAGYVGQLVDWSGNTLGIQILAARLVGCAMIVVGLIATWRLTKPWLRSRLSSRWWIFNRQPVRSSALQQVPTDSVGIAYVPPQPNWLTRQLIRLRPRLFRYPLAVRATIVGLLTALLPCGWLYLFALLAAGTGSAVAGAGLMAAFWLGSVPALVSLVASTRLLRASLQRALPFAASIMLIVAGAYTATGRGMAELNGTWKVSSSLVEQLQSGKSIHDLEPGDISKGMEQLVATPLPCCQTKADIHPQSSTQPGTGL